MTLFTIKFLSFTIWDIFDILIVYFLLYQLYKFFKGTRASYMLGGLVLIFLFSFVARLINLQAISWLLGQLQTVWVIAFVIIFQPELRRMLYYLGQTQLVRRFIREGVTKTIDVVVETAEELIRRKWGGLIVLAKETGVKHLKEYGTPLNAELTTSLLVSIFNPNSPLHDGAVVINNDIVEAAGCILPLSENPDLDPILGTRHRAALGASEESDAVVVVVSEETQKISVAYKGVLYRSIDIDNLKELLTTLYMKERESNE
ncbi:MAG: TIGR00159 family protein [Candidatus Marinimicrobia bacterium]|nr:TIGR00159 family protein [Candidatus Neomarinimicrobiota bacterium]